LPGFEYAARFGRRRSIESEGGWRPRLARWLGRDDLANVAPAVIAAAAVDAPTRAGPAAAPARNATVTPATAAPILDATVASAAAAPARDSAMTPPASSSAANSTAWLATPVHLIAGLTSLHLDRRSILRLPPTDCENLANDFNRTFAGSDLLLKPLPSGDFLILGPATLTGSTTEPSRALVADLEASLPKGVDAKPLKRLGAELEMWLHANPVNEARQRRGEFPASTLWLWGGGSTLATGYGTHGPTPLGQTPTQPNSAGASSNAPSDVAFGSDPFLLGLWHAQGARTHVLPDDKLAGMLGDPHAQRAALVTEVTPLLQTNRHWSVFEALGELDRLYISPALAALRSGILESVTLIANDTELRVGRHDRLKFWRRRRSTLLGLQPP
jgi:hypothetical protein